MSALTDTTPIEEYRQHAAELSDEYFMRLYRYVKTNEAATPKEKIRGISWEDQLQTIIEVGIERGLMI